MNSIVRSVLFGILLGISPIVLCLLFNWITPSVFLKDQSSLVSFAVMGLYAVTSLAVFVIAMILLIVKNRPITGSVAILVMIIQLILGVSYMAGI